MQGLSFETNQSSIDNLEAVTYTSVATAGNTPVSVADAAYYPQAPGIAEGGPSKGVYLRYTARFTIRNSLIASIGPKPGDTITRADSTVWTILRALPPNVSGVWQLDAIDLVLSNKLFSMGTLTRPSNTQQDAAGRQALTSYTTIASNIPCRVQPIGGDSTDDLGRRLIPQRFTAYLGTQVVPEALDVFTAGGVSYTVLDFKLPQRIDQLMTLTLELVDDSSQLPFNSALPTISGTTQVGQTLTATTGTWSGSPTFTYQWFSAGVAIAGATSSRYTLQSSDAGNLVSVVITATGSTGTSSISSQTVGPITSGGVTPAYNPVNDSRAVAIYDPRTLNLSDGANIGTANPWSDSSQGGGNTITVGTSTLKLNQINGLPVVRFNGTSDYLQITTNSGLQPTRITIGLLVRGSSAPGASSYILSKPYTADSGASYAIQGNTGGGGGIRGVGDTATSGQVLTPVFPAADAWNNEPHILVFKLLPGTGIFLYADGTDEAAGSNPAVGAINYDSNNIYFGAYSPATLNAAFDLVYAVIYETALPDADRWELEGFLGNLAAVP